MNALPPYYPDGHDPSRALSRCEPGISVSIRPAEVAAPLQPGQKKALRGFIRRILDVCLGRGADAADRLTEAGIRVAEGEAAVRHADAEQKHAAAAKLYAEADAVKAEAAIKHAEADHKRAETRQKMIQADAAEFELQERKRRAEQEAKQQAALDQLRTRIETIRMKGGDVEFDMEDLQRLLIILPQQPRALLPPASPVPPPSDGLTQPPAS